VSSVRLRNAVVRGTVRAPPSKSYTHRALVSGHLAKRTYRVVRPLDSDDTRATARAIRALGSTVRFGKNSWTIRPRRNAPFRRTVRIDCGESGTTLRFTAALGALEDRRVILEGRGRLPRRPMAALLSALRRLGARCRAASSETPWEVHGPIHSGRVALDSSESSQFASALLLTLPTLPGNSVLELTGPIVSAPYLEATRAVLEFHRIRVRRRGRRFFLPGGQSYRGSRFRVPGDASSAAYLWAAAAVTGGSIRVTEVPMSWPQADLAILGLLETGGASVRRFDRGAEVSGRIERPFTIDLTDSPDLYPLAGVLAAVVRGRSELRGAAHAALKESDRRAGTALLARSLGARVGSSSRGLEIEGTDSPRAFALPNLTDHRLVMSAAVGALAARGTSKVGERHAVDKSFPGFWTTLRTITQGSSGP
jgi:3-phosphoshikimate 1-carboxyvinyltransferase